jgi:hypothetical protein
MGLDTSILQQFSLRFERAFGLFKQNTVLIERMRMHYVYKIDLGVVLKGQGRHMLDYCVVHG